ncbi:hypothetical protein B447_14749 [Thauera sp. 27]|nr:hypothetical protein B447_14749 [Thauera sp. 27]
MQLDLFAPTDTAFIGVEVGAEVGARRWPWASRSPDQWIQPVRGIVISRRDDRIWVGSVLGHSPSQEEIDRYVAARADRLNGSIPVIWDYGPIGLGKTAMWESVADLRSYAEDLADWQLERAKALEEQVNG